MQLGKLRGSFAIDGEVCLLDWTGIPNFEGMRDRAVRKRGELVTYFALDLLFLNGRDLRALPAARTQDAAAQANRQRHAAPPIR